MRVGTASQEHTQSRDVRKTKSKALNVRIKHGFNIGQVLRERSKSTLATSSSKGFCKC